MTVLVPEFLPVDTYTFARLRRVFEAAQIQEGVYDVGELKVTQRAAGANKSVDVAAGRAWVRGDDTARQGSYHCENDGTVNLAIADNTSGLSRIDQIIQHVYDSSVIGGGTNAAPIEVLEGTPTAGATVDNRQGAAALPASAIRLADIPVASGFSSITNAIIRDRRPWARGYFNGQATRTTPTTYSATTRDALDTTNLRQRVECSGVPLRLTFKAKSFALTAVALVLTLGFIDESGIAYGEVDCTVDAAGAGRSLPPVTTVINPAAGSHLMSVSALLSAGGQTATLAAAATGPMEFIVEEILRQNAANT